MRTTGRGRVWPTAGLAMLSAGIATASVGVGSGAARVSLTVLAIGVAYALVDEIRLQARRREGWTRADTVNCGVLALAASVAAGAANVPDLPRHLLGIGAVLGLTYAAAAGFFVLSRRRTVGDGVPTQDAIAG